MVQYESVLGCAGTESETKQKETNFFHGDGCRNVCAPIRVEECVLKLGVGIAFLKRRMRHRVPPFQYLCSQTPERL